MNTNRKTEIIIASLIILVVVFIIGKVSFSSKVEEGIEVSNMEELTYYLNVSYDGVDVDGQNTNLQSGYINVEEILPDELQFVEFIKDDIKAKNNITNATCQGSILNNNSGLNYDTKTNKISFTVKDLEANCTLSVGIRVKVNTESNSADIYTVAVAQENDQIVFSNDNYFYVGNKDIPRYETKIAYNGEVPPSIAKFENIRSYLANKEIKLDYLNINGYRITKYQTADVNIQNNLFKLPEKDVAIAVSLEKEKGNNVKYVIAGYKPDGYQEPKSKTYSKNSTVYLDKLSEGDVIGGYIFLGWKTDDAKIDNNKFLMPDNEVTLYGEFTEQKYDVCYRLSPTDNTEEECFTYTPGETVELIENENQGNYLFLGWNKEDNFTMPAENVTITSNWQKVNGFFKPIISFESLEEEPEKILTFFNIGDDYNTGLKVNNLESYSIKDVIVKLEGTNASISPNTKFSICNEAGCIDSKVTYLRDNIIRIDEIPAHSYFITNKNSVHTEFNEENAGTQADMKLRLLGAIADDDYYLQEKEQLEKIFNVKAKVTICNNINEVKGNHTFQYHISSSQTEETSSNEFDTWVTLENTNCKSLYLAAGDYKVAEIIPQTWTLTEVKGNITKNDTYFHVDLNKSYQIDFFNTFTKKGYYHSSGRVSSKIKGIG